MQWVFRGDVVLSGRSLIVRPHQERGCRDDDVPLIYGRVDTNRQPIELRALGCDASNVYCTIVLSNRSDALLPPSGVKYVVLQPLLDVRVVSDATWRELARVQRPEQQAYLDDLVVSPTVTAQAIER